MAYAKLRGKIKEVFNTQGAFAEAMGTSVTNINSKLNERCGWSMPEIRKACELLGIPLEEIYIYF